MSTLLKTFFVLIGVIIDAIPVIANKLKRLEPKIAPKTKFICPLRAATIDVTTSGIDVPNATTVRPIIVWETPNKPAVITAPLTKICAPIIIPMIPSKEKSIDFCKPKFFSKSSVSIFLIPFEAWYITKAK